MKGEEPRSRWYAVAVRVGREARASASLEERGFRVLLPTLAERRVWSDRVKQVRVPVFPGYVFLHGNMTAATRVRILGVTEVFDLVGRTPGEDRIALHIPEAEIESIQQLYASECSIDPVHQLTVGRAVTVICGPLKGLRGIIDIGADKKRRLVVNVTLLGRGVRALLSADDVVSDDPLRQVAPVRHQGWRVTSEPNR